MKKILLTGAAGFVGRQVLRVLADKNVQVRCVLRQGRQVPLTAHSGREQMIASPDIFAEDTSWWAEACQAIDTVIHLAWYAEPCHYLQSSRNLNCLIGALQLARGARCRRKEKFKRVIRLGPSPQAPEADGQTTCEDL